MTNDVASLYYIRVAFDNTIAFEEYLQACNSHFTVLSIDYSEFGPTNLYSARLDSEMALSLKLRFPLVGFMNFSRTLTKQPHTGEHHEQK